MESLCLHCIFLSKFTLVILSIVIYLLFENKEKKVWQTVAMKLVCCQLAWPLSSPALEEDNKFSEIASTKTSGSLQPPSTWSKIYIKRLVSLNCWSKLSGPGMVSCIFYECVCSFLLSQLLWMKIFRLGVKSLTGSESKCKQKRGVLKVHSACITFTFITNTSY